MRGNWGEHFKLTIFGESHGPAIGIVIDGVPAGFPIDEEEIRFHMARRAPGKDPTATARKEADSFRILSGILNGRATGTPIAAIIENTNTHSADYSQLASLMRPGHADYAGYVRYHGYNDPRGGGHFSGRLTAPIVFAGSVARQILASDGIAIGSHIASVSSVEDRPFSAVDVSRDLLSSLSQNYFPLLDIEKEKEMRACIAAARAEEDSVGGQIECTAIGVPAGIGSPFFGSVESVFSSLAFSIPAVKAVEFGDGTAITQLRGSQANDPLKMQDEHVICTSNHNGGITGGITNGMPIVLRVSVKPTPSISKAQQTVNIVTHTDETLRITGRHDPCIVPRAVPVVESALAISLLELQMDAEANSYFSEEGVIHEPD